MLATLVTLILLRAITAQSQQFRRYVTPHIVSHVQAQLRLAKTLQSWRSPTLTRIVTVSAGTICIEFFAVTLPVLAWCGFPEVAWLMVICMAMHNYMCLFIKDLLCAPRPMQCGAKEADLQELKQLVAGANDATWNAEYGLPSSHTSLSLTYFLTLSGLLYQHEIISVQAAAGVALASLIWGVWIGFCRMYSIMHSLADVLAGALLAVVTAAVFVVLSSRVLLWVTAGSWLSGAALAAGSMLVYPTPLRSTPSFLDAVAFNGAALGVVLGGRLGMHMQPLLDLHSWPHVVLGAAPARLRALWQLPVHDMHAVDAAENGTQTPQHQPSGMNSSGDVVSKMSRRSARAASQVACDQDGLPMDVKLYSRLCRYTVLGWTASCACPLAFQLLGILRE
eukprot:jgi/Ulvmu1/12169/UM085_0033.1